MTAEAKAAIAGVFDRAAPTYDQVGVEFFGRVGADLVAAADPRPGERLLDVGCGRGASLLPAAEAVGPGGRATGIDLAPAMVAAVRAEAARRGLAQVEVRVGDAEDPDLPAGSLDLVLGGLVLFFLPDAPAAVRRYARLLRPGGRLAVATFAEEDESAGRPLFQALAPFLPPTPEPDPGDPPPPQKRLRTRESLAALLDPAGLTDLRWTERTYEVRVEPAERHWDWMWSQGMRHLLELIPPDRLAEAGAAVVAAGAGVPTLTYPVRITTARRPG